MTDAEITETTDNNAAVAQPVEWGVKEGDFFPYADCEHCYWAGYVPFTPPPTFPALPTTTHHPPHNTHHTTPSIRYFTSRPALKRMERTLSGYLVTARQIEAIAGKLGFVFENGRGFST